MSSISLGYTLNGDTDGGAPFLLGAGIFLIPGLVLSGSGTKDINRAIELYNNNARARAMQRR